MTAWPPALAAASTAAAPPKTIKSAMDTSLPQPAWTLSKAAMTLANCTGWLAAQSFCGARRTRAPFAPPRLSVPRKVEAEAQAAETRSETERLVPMMADFNSTISEADKSAFPAGIGSCQIRSSAGTSVPRYRIFGPMSRWVSLNHARAKASAKASGLAWKCREIFS